MYLLSYSGCSFITSCFIPFGDGGAFVVGFFTFGEGDLEFGASIFQIHARRHDRHTFDADIVPQFANLLFMEQQAAFPSGFMVEEFSRLFVWRDMRFHQPGFLSVLHVHIGFLDADLAGANGLDLRSMQDKSSLKSFQEEVFEACFAVGCENLYVFRHKMILPLIE